MSARTARWIAWSLVGAFIILATAGLSLQAISQHTYAGTSIVVLIILNVLVGMWIVTGALIVSRHPRHPVGWLLCAGLFSPAFDMFAAGYIAYDTLVFLGSLPGVGLALVWLKLANLGALGTAALALIVLLFPDGHPPSPRWRVVTWTSIGTLILYLPLQALEPGPVDPDFLPGRIYPFGVSASLWAYLEPLKWMAFSILMLCYAAALLSLVSRLRRARGDERQQVKWLIFPASLFWVSLLMHFFGLFMADELIAEIFLSVAQAAVAGMVIAIAFAIFKYRLYDIDLIINRTLVYGGLTVAIAAVYALSVGAAGLALQQESQWAGLLLTAGIAAILYRPLHSAVQQGVDRLLGSAPAAPAAVPALPKSPEVDAGAEQLETGHAALPRRWRRVARAAWIVCAVIAWGIIILSVPASIATSGDLEGSLAGSQPSSLLYVLNVVSILAYTAAALISLVLAGVLFFKRPNDRMALFLSFFLLPYGIAAAGSLISLEPLWSGIEGAGYRVILPVIVAPLLVAFLSIFPNGRLTPPWTRGLVVVAFVYAPVREYLLNANVYFALLTPLIQGGLLWFGLIFVGLYAQIYRYRRVSNPTERQQTKWVVYGFTLGVLLALLLTVGTFNHNRMPPGTPLPWWVPLGGLGWPLAMAALPVSLTFAVIRYRLYDIDVLINRTLVYGALTGSVIALYALIVGTFGVLFQSGGNLIVALVATGLVAVLFQPLRARLQKGVNRLMYGDRDEPFTVLRRLGQRLESSAMPEDILTAIVETVAQALKLPYAEVALRRGEKFERAAQSGKFANERVPFPIQYQGQTIGYLNVAPRRPGESLAESDKGLLRQIARQAGPVAYTVQLTRDLRRSRTRLVTAREEERRRLRRDLHDGLGPVLASQGLKIAAVSHLLESDPEAARKLLDELASQNEATVAEIRRLVYALRPPELDELGLAGAVRDYAAGLDIRTADGEGFEIDVQPSDGELPELPAAVEVAAYRIAAEALTNVTRHARARHCTVSFKIQSNSSENVLVLEITDDGVGLPKGGKAGIGMNSMRERAEDVQGELHIESIPSEGTRVVASLPLRR